MKFCEHFEQVEVISSDAKGCEECLRIGDTWVHLRMCLVCGKVGCCDQSPNQHTRRHWEQTTHPVIQSYEPNEEWVFCFADDFYSEEPPPSMKSG